MPSKLDAELVKQIRNELQFSETADLVEIWQTNDPGEWTAEGFEAVRGLLVERLGPIPPREKSGSWKVGLEMRAQRYLNRAEAFVENGKFEKALAECEAALQIAPNMAAAHNCRGVLLEAKQYVLEAIEAYRTALRLDPKFAEARENLRAAEREWREEDSPARPTGPAEPDDPALSGDYVIELGSMPAELYLSEASRILPGWPGYRTRPGRSGYDYLDTTYEEAHMEGVFLRLLFTGKLRTGSWVGLASLAAIGMMVISPLVFGVAEIVAGQWQYLVLTLLFTVIWAPGLLLLWNVACNVRDLLRDH